MRELDILNAMLASVGETPLNELSEEHSLSAMGQGLIRRELRKVNSRDWWYNVYNTTLQPDVNGYVFVPEGANAAAVGHGDVGLVQRGRRLFDRHANTYEIKRPVPVRIRDNPALDDLPYQAYLYVEARAVYAFNRSQAGEVELLRDLDRDRMEAFVELRSEHIKQNKTNLLDSALTAHRLNRVGLSSHAFPRIR